MSRCLVVALAATALLSTGCSKTKPDCKGTAVACGDVCVDPSSDNRNCGTCGNACEAGTACSSGVCAVICAAGRVNCDGSCIDPQTDRSHCGAAGSCTGAEAGLACSEGQLCSAGACAQTCSTGQTACPTTDPTYCADLTRDANNCGGCGTVCSSGTSCSGGACRSSCPAGEYACGGRCIDPQSDPVYCGAATDCSGGTTCRVNEACQHGVCTPVARVATPIVGGDPGLTSWGQTVPAEDEFGSFFPGQANTWELDGDFSLAGGFGLEYSAALQLAVGDVTPSPTLSSLLDDWESSGPTGLLHLLPADQSAAEVTFLTPRFGTADGVVTATIATGIWGVLPLDGAYSGFLNGTADSRLVRTVTLAADETYTLTWRDEIQPEYALLLGADQPPYGPRYQVVLRNPTTGAQIGDPLFVTTSTSWTSASSRTASFSTTPGNVPPGPVDLSFDLRSAAFGSAVVDGVVLATGAGPVASFDNGDFEAGIAPWRYEGGGESRNARSGARTIDVDPASATTLVVTRTFYSPPTAAWARLVDEFRNDRDVPVTAKIVYRTTLGGYIPETVLAADGRAVVGRDAAGTVRDVGLVFGSGSAFFDPTAAGEIFIVHGVTVPAHGRVALAQFVVQLGQGAVYVDHYVDHPTTATDAVCAAIADGFPGEYVQDLEPDVLGRIANF